MNSLRLYFIIFIVTGLLSTFEVQASTTQLSKISKVVEQTNSLVHHLIASNKVLDDSATVDVITSYIPGQGLSVVIKPLKLAAVTTKPTVAAPIHSAETPDSIKQKQVRYWQKSKAMAHEARSLSQQIKSLTLSIKQSDGDKKTEFKQRLQQVKARAQTLTQQRQQHATFKPAAIAVAKPQNPLTPPLTPIHRHAQFYHQLAQQLSEKLCRKANIFSAIDPQEQLSIVYLQGGEKYKNRYKTKGWSINLALLAQCQLGKLTVTQLNQQASPYQY